MVHHKMRSDGGTEEQNKLSESLVTIAKRLLEENMGVSADETLVVVTDTAKRIVGRALFQAGVDLGTETGLIEMRPRERNGVEPPEYVTAAMCESDVVVAPTSTSLTHTRAREQACKAGTRIATMPGITADMFDGGAITANYGEIEEVTAKVTERLTEADEARIVSGHGKYELTMSVKNRNGIVSDGIVRDQGSSGNLPSGEGYIAPVEDTASGEISFDGGLAGMGTFDEPLVIQVQSGSATSVEGESAGAFLDATSGGKCARRVAELGLGTNPAADIVGTVLEDEKVYGTCHIAFGDNLGFGGTIECDSHLDGIVLEPEVFLDDELIMSGGDVVI